MCCGVFCTRHMQAESVSTTVGNHTASIPSVSLSFAFPLRLGAFAVT